MAASAVAVPLAQTRAKPSANASDLDQLMADVLSNRDQNWKKLQQYILDERQTALFEGPGGIRLFGQQSEYRWFPREGFFIRSPLNVNGVTIGDADRREAEEKYLEREKRREQRRQKIRKENQEAGIIPDNDPGPGEPDAAGNIGDVLRQTAEPEFIRSAYFLQFKFDEGQYALVGREQLLGRPVLRIEYYPTRLFADDPDERPRTREEREKREASRRERLAKETARDRERREKGDQMEARIERQMNKVAKATLWVDPELKQILQYQLHNMEMDFLPGRSLLRVDEMNAQMRMTQPFPGVWLPDMVEIRAGFMTAIGRLSGRFDVKYSDYRLAETGARLVK